MEGVIINRLFDVLFKVVILIFITASLYFGVQIAIIDLYEPPTPVLSDYNDILEQNPNDTYFRYDEKKYKTIYPQANKEHTQLIAIVNIDFSNQELSDEEQLEASHYYLNKELNDYNPNIVIINYSNKSFDFFGQAIYKLKPNIELTKQLKSDDYTYTFIKSELSELENYDTIYDNYQVANTNKRSQYLSDYKSQELSKSSILSYNIFDLLERPTYYEQTETLTMMQKMNIEPGILMAGMDLLVWNHYNLGLSHKYIPVTDNTTFSLYKDRYDNYVFGIKSNLPIRSKLYYYQAEILSYNMNFNLELGAYFIELGRIKEGADHLTSFSPFFNLSQNMNHSNIEIVNDGPDLLVNGNEVWRHQERITIKRVEYLFDIDYSYVYKD